MSVFILDSTTKTIKVALSSAVATTNPDYTVSYADNTGTAFTEGSSDGALSGTTDVTICSAPAASTRRVIKGITIQNRDTAAVTAIIKYDNNGTQRIIARVTLAVNDTWTTDGTFDSTGALKQSTSNATLTNITLNGTTTFGGSVTPATNTVDSVGYIGMPQNSQSAAYTLVASDAGKSIVHPISDNNARTYTIPANSSVAFPVGTTITFVNLANTVTIAITTDTMYLAGAGSTGSRTLAAYGIATAIKVTSTSWIISGNGLT